MAEAAADRDGDTLAGLLRAHRERLLWSQEELAARAGISARTVRNLESGAVRRPRGTSVRLLADALRLDDQARRSFEAAAARRRQGPPDTMGTPLAADTDAAPPRELPLPAADFTGRRHEARRLSAVLTRSAERAATVPVVVVYGRAGVGKTCLVTHLAHAHAAAFPDGQLYVSLRGSRDDPLPPDDVLGRLLRSLGVAPGDVPVDADERGAMLRSLLYRRAVLLVLDDAAGASQVRPLLPGAGRSAALITSRAPLTTLPVTESLSLDVLPPSDAVHLYRRIVSDHAGQPRTQSALSDHAMSVVRLCGCLPLAVRIAATRLAAHPYVDAVHFVEALRDERRALDELRVGDLEVRASIRLSFLKLSPRDRRAYCLLSLLRSGATGAWVVAALLDMPLRDAEAAVERLVDAQILTLAEGPEAGGPRYRMHDLIRVFGREQAAAFAPREITTALGRMFTAYLWMARQADARLSSPTLDPYPPYRTDHDTWEPDGADADALTGLLDRPLDWFEAEHDALTVAVLHACDIGMVAVAWRVVHAMLSFLATHRHIDSWRRIASRALAAARAAADREAEAYMLRALGQAYLECDDLTAADRHFEQALAAFGQLADPAGTAFTMTLLGYTRRLEGRLPAAVGLFDDALAALRRIRLPRLTAYTLANLAIVYREQGRNTDARPCILEALTLYRRAGDRRYLAYLLRSLGLLDVSEGAADCARGHFAEALPLMRDLGDRFGEALVLADLGGVHPDRACARRLVRESLTVSRRTGDRFAVARALFTLGEIDTDERPAEAAEALAEALTIWRDIHMPLWEARTLDSLAATCLRRSDVPGAIRLWQQALNTFRALGAPQASTVERRLSDVGGDVGQPTPTT